MHCKTREKCPFSGLFLGVRGILSSGGYLLKLAFKSGSRKGGLSKGAFCAKQTFLQGNGCAVRFHREMDCPVQWSLATPSALESQARANQGSVVANPICKCRRHKAGHLQVRVAVGKRSTRVLKEAPLNKGPLGFPQIKDS